MLGLFATSYFIDTHPIFVPIFALLLVIAIIVAIPISNAYEELSENATLSEAASQQGVIVFLMLHLPIVAFIIGLLSLLIAFAKTSGGASLAWKTAKIPKIRKKRLHIKLSAAFF